MKTIYILGNGTVEHWQIKYLANKEVMTFNRAVSRFDEWGWLPQYHTSLELNDLEENREFLFKYIQETGILKAIYNKVKKIFPKMVQPYLATTNPEGDIEDPPNTQFYHFDFWDRGNSLSSNQQMLGVGCSGASGTFMALKILDYDRAVLLGCDCWRENAGCPMPGTKLAQFWESDYRGFLKYTNDYHQKGWRRLKWWCDHYSKPKTVLNASVRTKIQADIPKIKLGEEND